MSDEVGSSVVRHADLGERVLAAAPVVILVIDRDGAIEYANPFFERMTGYRLDEIRGKDWFATFVPERERVRRRALFRESSAGGRARERVNPIVTRTGEEREIEWTDELLRDADANPTGVLAVGHDVTERNIAQDALRASNQYLSEAHRIANLSAWRIDLATGVDWWSDEHYRMAGYPVGTPVTHALFRDLVHPDDRAMFARVFDKVVAEGVGEAEFRIVRPDGEVRDIHGRARLIYDEGGRPIAMAGTDEDITERKRAEEAMRRASELLHTVVANAPVVMFALDRDGIFTLSEGRGLDKLGLKPGEVVGASALEMYKDVPGWPEVFRRALAGEQIVEVSRAGDLEFEGVYAPSIDTRGNIDGVIGVAYDVTERKRAEIQLQASVTEQRRLVDELREADRRKDDFIAILSHELRNPLSAIQNGVYILNRVQAADDPTRRATRIIERQAAQLTRLVDDLLDVSRITRDKIHLQREPLDLEQLVRTVVDDHRAMFARRDVQLDVNITGGPLIVHGDAARLTQVVGNLLNNAVKFTPSGGRTTISLARDAAAGRAILRVTDTGAGIAAPMLERMFEPFAQADRTLARSMGGLGLGLALVKGLVELHGGDVSVRSEGEGHGAELTARLPLDRAAEPTAAPSTTEPAQPTPRRILVIEDNVDAADALREFLELDGHVVKVAYDGAEGIRLARESRPDIVLCDIGLPSMSGYDVARALAHDEALQATKLVALSGYATPKDVAKARAAGFNDHLAKPVHLQRLRAVLEAATPRGV